MSSDQEPNDRTNNIRLDNQAEWRIRYRDLEFGAVIGIGTFGRVYEGTWNKHPVALKTIVINLEHGNKFDDLTKTKKWREFEVWQKLKYPYIVHLFGVAVRTLSAFAGEWELTFVMQKCEISLFELLNTFPDLSIDSRIKYSYEIALGMKHIHENDILHRDLKCMNVLILNDVAKICDFGTSRIKDENTIDMTRECVGSPSHMAPEIWAKRPASRESDIWSFAMCLYNIFTGIPPFDGKDMYELYNYLIVKDKRPEWPRRKNTPRWIKDLANDCWVKRAHNRMTFDKICERFVEHAGVLLDPPQYDESKEEYVLVDPTLVSITDRYIASMVLSAVGDIIGFFNAKFEALDDGTEIHKQVAEKGGALLLDVGKLNLRLSSDTMMSIAIAQACASDRATNDFEVSQEGLTPIMEAIAEEYIRSFMDMRGRYPGGTTKMAIKRLGWKLGSEIPVEELRKNGCNWYDTVYNRKAGGCGGTTRACPIGLRYPGKANRQRLIAVAIESGRLTHNQTTGYLGSLTAALFTAYALEGVDVYKWGHLLIYEVRSLARQYLDAMGRDLDNIRKDFKTFFIAWNKYLKERGIENGKGPVKFPRKYDVKARDAFYKSYSFAGKGGASGHDAVIIAYDALLGALQASGNSPKKMWEEILLRGVLHGGDSDSTGTIIGAWYGALYGFTGVPDCNHKTMEKVEELKALGTQLAEVGGVLLQGKKHKSKSG